MGATPKRITAWALTGIVGAAALFIAGALPWRIRQPSAFNHKLHIEDVGADCADCHPHALTGVRATIPNIEVCVDCHEEAQTDSPAEAEIVQYIASGEKIPWRKVYRVPDHVYFSHRRHTQLAGLECDKCHGAMEERVEPVTRQEWKPTMNNCMECHQESGVSNDCIFCHY